MNNEHVQKAVESFTYEGNLRNLDKEGLIAGIATQGNHVQISLLLGNNPNSAQRHLGLALCQHIQTETKAQSVTPIFVSSHSSTTPDRPSSQARTDKQASAPSSREKINTGARHVILVASGKGGVGKSTVAVNLAASFSQLGMSTALLDADIYGPSLPVMLGHCDKPESQDGKIHPIEIHGLKTMSIGYLIAPGKPVVWRGPMVMGALEQMLKDVKWDNPDVMVIDLPPGTGDAQLTLAQRVHVDGAVIVSTPQDLALADVKRGIAMFRQVQIPVHGVIENMAYYLCPCCSTRSYPFGQDGVKKMAAELSVDYLGGLPLHSDIRAAGDSGTPLVLQKDARQDVKDAFSSLARTLMKAV